MPNELKIQLESRADLVFVEEQVRRALPADVSAAEAERFMAVVSGALSQNVQVDGVDWDALPSAPAAPSESVDARLETRLAELQRETDALLVRVGALRRSVPEEVAEQLSAAVCSAEESIAAVGAADATIADAPLGGDVCLDAARLDCLAGEIDRLRGLGASIPALVAKLQRAQALLADAPRLEAGDGESKAAPVDAKTDADAAAAARLRQIAREHELASRLLHAV